MVRLLRLSGSRSHARLTDSTMLCRGDPPRDGAGRLYFARKSPVLIVSLIVEAGSLYKDADIVMVIRHIYLPCRIV